MTDTDTSFSITDINLNMKIISTDIQRQFNHLCQRRTGLKNFYKPYELMHIVGHSDINLSASEIASNKNVIQQYIRLTLKQLEDLKFIENNQANKKDRRFKEITLTETGKHMLTQLDQISNQLTLDYLPSESQYKFKELETYLKNLAHRINL